MGDTTPRLQDTVTTRQAWYVLFALTVGYVFSFIDRQIISLLVEPLKRDLRLSDTQISLLQGFSFAVFLAMSSLPIGRLIDLKRRMTIIALGMAFWSVMTACSGLASSFGALLLCRIGVGIGEATLTPAAHSIIADSFPKRRLGLALGVFGTGTFLGQGLAYLLGAAVLADMSKMDYLVLPALGAFRPWQVVFLVIGPPGLLVALWIFRLKEPPRLRVGALTLETPTLRDVANFFSQHASPIILVNLTLAFAAMTAYSITAWVPSFLIRTFGWTAQQAGATFGPLVVICGLLGSIAGNVIGDHAAKRFVAGRLLVMAASSFCAAPFAAAAPLVADPYCALACLAIAVCLITATIGIGPSVQQAIMPSQMRGIASAVGVLMVNLLGLGIGPTVIAMTTDHLFHDPLLIRYSLASLTPVMLMLSAVSGLAGLARYTESLNSST